MNIQNSYHRTPKTMKKAEKFSQVGFGKNPDSPLYSTTKSAKFLDEKDAKITKC